MSNQLKATKWESSPKSMLSTEDSISPLIKPQPYQAGPSVEPGPNNPVPKRVTTNILQRKPKLSLGFAKKDDWKKKSENARYYIGIDINIINNKFKSWKI